MKFKCPKCKKIIQRDGRETLTKHNLTKRGLKTYCEETSKDVIAPLYKSNP